MVRLRSLKLRGFKTFARPTELVFEPGITVIIGPNGSGKSNLADAVLWVLGEQSPQNLRGKAMQDVIFTGPGGQRSSAVAEVSLVFEDGNGELPWGSTELEITRRLTRDSGSEYRLNGRSCRLLDVHEVIGALGLGREMHSVVSQGKVEAFLSSTPAARRALIEEAAGLGRFKKRRERAEAKLEKTRQNLLRISDIQKEVEAALRPLRQQVTAAERFAQATEEWAQAKARFLLHSLYEVNQALGAADTGLNRLEGQRKELEMRLGLLEEERRGKESAFALALERRDALTAAWHRAAALTEHLEGRTSTLRQRLARAEGEIDRALRRLELARTQRDSVLAREAALGHDIRDQSRLQLVMACAKSIGELHAEVLAAVEVFTEKEEDLKDAVFAAEAARSRALQDREFLRRELSERERVTTELKAMAAGLVLQQEELEGKKQALKEELSVVLAGLEEAGKICAQAGEERELVAARLREAVAAERELTEALAALERRAKVLEDVVDKAQGIASGARSLRVAGARLLGELISVEPGYERAVTAALGPVAGAAVVPPELGVEEVLLHEGPLEAVRDVPGETAPSAPVPLPAGSRDLWELVSGPEKVISALRLLVPPTAVVEDRQALAQWSGALSSDWRLVSREGELVQGGCLIARRQELGVEALLKARNELEATRCEYEELARRRAEVRADLEQARVAVTAAEQRAEAAKERVREVEKRAAALQAELDLTERRLAEVCEQGQETRARLQREEEMKAGLVAEIEAAEQAITDRERELELTRGALEGLQREAEQARSRLAKLQYKKSQASLLELKLRERCRALEQEKARLKEQRESAEQEAGRSQRRVGWLRQYAPLVGALLETAERLASLSRAATEELEAAVDKARGAVDKAAQEMREQGGTEAGLQSEHEALLAKSADLHVEKARLEERKLRLEEELAELTRRHLAPRSVRYEEVIGEDAGTLLAALERAERRRERIGPVNPLAAQECAQLEHRAQFLAEQRADLEASLIRLQEVIRELDEHIERTFHEVFSATRRHFASVVAAVFPGAKGELRLTEPKGRGRSSLEEEDSLEAEDVEQEEKAGIAVEVKFPNKAPRTLSLLSGGEKAMTAIAFLFSVFLARPCPFYILDEVEASLDDINIRRFLSLVRKYKDKTQFIIITHQRQTMEVADTLYGVALEKDGTSRVLSRRLTVAKGA